MNPNELKSEGINASLLEKTKKYVLGGLTQPLPSAFESTEIGRITLMMFYVGSYKLLFPDKPINTIINVDETIKYVLTSLRVQNNKENSFQGFTGCEMFGEYEQGHISYTYAALGLLSQLGYDLTQLDKNLITSIQSLFRPEADGVFATSIKDENEYDIRFIYSLCATCYLLNDWGNVDKEKLFQFIMKCRSYDYAFAQMPNRESHGGSTYCAIQSLSLMNMLDRLDHKTELVQWLTQRYYLGFSGRINKRPDTCYNYWIGSSLKTLGLEHLIEKKFVISFTESCISTKYGGVGKDQESQPDPMHTFCSLTGLALIGALKVNYHIDSRIGIEHPFYLNSN